MFLQYKTLRDQKKVIWPSDETNLVILHALT